MFAQIVADALGVDVEDVRVVTGDTREFHWGTGTFASRGAVVAGSACHAAAHGCAREDPDARQLAAERAAGRARARRRPRRSCATRPSAAFSLGELAGKANPLRGAVRPGTEPGLESTAYFGPDRGSTASGVHAMIVEVDPETAMVEIKRYVVVHDCGTIINPMLVEGQIHGGVAHGIGNAFYEQLVYDEQGQLLNASFMDYLLPTATDVPPIETDSSRDAVAVQSGRAEGRRRSRLHSDRRGVRAGGRGCARATPASRSREIPLSPNRLFEL